MLRYCYPGETVRVTARDLTHSDTGPVTTGATVTVGWYDSAGALVAGTSGNAAASGDDWFFDVDAPATAGEYIVKVTADKSGAIWKGSEPITVLTF